MAHFSRADHVYLDFDFARSHDRRARRYYIQSPRLRPIWTVLRIVGLEPQAIEYERTRRGWHVIIPLGEKLRAAELVALQACCGSDGRREALNLMRVLAMRRKGAEHFWRRRWNILFSGKLPRGGKTKWHNKRR